MTRRHRFRLGILALTTITTLGVHYGWLVEPFFGHVHWLHTIHGRFCYVPIMMAAAWYGLRGGIVAATVISLAVIPLIVEAIRVGGSAAVDTAEIIFYYGIGALIGLLVDRENNARRAEAKAHRHMERAQELSLAGQIASGVAHEIKNPLASIKGAADILSDPNTPDPARVEFRDILQREVRRIDNTVDEFLAFARPRETRLEPTDLGDVARRAVRQLESQATEAGVKLTSDIDDRVMIQGDADKLHQLALNLLLNALQASPAGAEVCVRAGSSARRVTFEVRDRGPGIPSGDIDRIFEPFFTTRSSGTGLGLALVRGIVEDHAGTIAVDAPPDGGTTVRAEFPPAEVRR